MYNRLPCGKYLNLTIIDTDILIVLELLGKCQFLHLYRAVIELHEIYSVGINKKIEVNRSSTLKSERLPATTAS